MSKDNPPSNPIGPIVSSAHLAATGAPEMSELEFAITIVNNGFQRWMIRCAAASGEPDMSPLDVLVMHLIYHRDKPKKLADLSLVLNQEDIHTVNYSVKKLEKKGLVDSQRSGNEKLIQATAKGEEFCRKYTEIRDALLVSSLNMLGDNQEKLSETASVLRTLSGLYDQAARAAASL